MIAEGRAGGLGFVSAAFDEGFDKGGDKGGDKGFDEALDKGWDYLLVVAGGRVIWLGAMR